MKTASFPEDKNELFAEAVKAAIGREKGIHGSVGTQNEKLIHAALKNYYVPSADDQEIKLGSFFADAVSEDGIFEIQTRGLYRLAPKLRELLEYSRVTIVHPVIAEYHTLYINEESGELAKATAPRKMRSKLKIFEELYSIREFLQNENLRIILVSLSVEKRVYFRGESLPDMQNRFARKRCRIEKLPLKILDETTLEKPRDYRIFLPKKLPAGFTKKQLSKAANESSSSLRTEVLRTAGIIGKVGKSGREYVYEVLSKENQLG